MRVLRDRFGMGRAAVPAHIKVMGPFATAPAVAFSAARRPRLKVDLLPEVLAHIRDVEIAGNRIERIAPRVAQSEGPDLVVARGAHEGIRGGGDFKL